MSNNERSAPTVVNVRSVGTAESDIVYIGRGTRQPTESWWGNPFVIPTSLRDDLAARRAVIVAFDDWAQSSDSPSAIRIRANIGDLTGKRLACWCSPRPCHGNVLIKLWRAWADREATT